MHVPKIVEQAENEIPILRNIWHREVSMLSGGQQQALVIFCRTLAQSTLFLLDEITASVDVISAKPLMSYFRHWINAQNAAGLIVSHDLSEVSEYADRVLVFANGKLITDLQTPEYGKFQASELSDILHNAWQLH